MGLGWSAASGLSCRVICSFSGKLVLPLKGSGDNRKSQDPEVPSQLLVPAQWPWSLRVWVPGRLVALDGQAGAGGGPEAQPPCPFQNARGCPAGHR